jgi:hypothetical protein
MFHVLAYNPLPPEKGFVENNFLSHTIQSLVFSLTRVIRIDIAVQKLQYFKRHITVRELSTATHTANRTLEFKSLSLFSNSKTRTESQVC